MRAFPKNQSEVDLRNSGLIVLPATCNRESTFKISTKNIPIATSWEIAQSIKNFFVEIYLCSIQRGISSKNATKFASQRNIPTSVTLSRRIVKKYTTEK